jgi:hypothetical protein
MLKLNYIRIIPFQPHLLIGGIGGILSDEGANWHCRYMDTGSDLDGLATPLVCFLGRTNNSRCRAFIRGANHKSP